ncbi:MAG TPA: tetratricopeptide repeat protein, partial [Jatrophihabitantaceae bacterium]
MSYAPDPAAAHDPTEFREQLRRLKVWAGNPSFGSLARRSAVPRSTLADALSARRDTLPRLDVVSAFVTACGVGAATADTWRAAWRRIEVGPAPRNAARSLGSGAAPRPRELPYVAPELVGRADAVAVLDAGLRSESLRRVVAICGTAGVGKTALAVHWVRQLESQFPDGQLFINLRGYDREHPIEPVDALGTMLRSLLPTGTPIPSRLVGRTSMYRSLTAERRLVVLLDNADSSAVVRELLPAGPGCLAVVTSRDSLSGLVARDGAARLELAPLSVADAVTLLQNVTGRPASDELTRLAHRCALVPLALRLAAELLLAGPQLAVADLLAELDEAGPLSYLGAEGDDQTSVRAMFALSYQKLSANVAEAFRLLGLHPGADYDSYALAALAASEPETARHALRTLRRAYLLEEFRPGRYAMHDLLRSYAVELADLIEPVEREAALDRLVDYYSGTTARAARVLYPYLPPDGSPPAPVARLQPDVGDVSAATTWLGQECGNLVRLATSPTAAARPGGLDVISSAMSRYLKDTARYVEAQRVHGAAIDAARHGGDELAEIRALVYGGTARLWLGDYADAMRMLDQAASHPVAAGHPTLLFQCVNGKGIALFLGGDPGRALALFRRADTVARRIGSPFARANALSNVGMSLERTGHPEQARTVLAEARELYSSAGYRGGEGSAIENLGCAELALGNTGPAIEHFVAALDIARDVGWLGLETTVLNNLGRAEVIAGRLSEAATHYERAALLARNGADRAELAHALCGLGDLAMKRRQVSEAIRQWKQ